MLIVPDKVIGNSNNFTFFPVSELRDVDICLLRFYECVRIVWVYVGGMDTPKVKHFSPLFIISPGVLPILSFVSPISMLKENSLDHSRFIYLSNVSRIKERKPLLLSNRSMV